MNSNNTSIQLLLVIIILLIGLYISIFVFLFNKKPDINKEIEASVIQKNTQIDSLISKNNQLQEDIETLKKMKNSSSLCKDLQCGTTVWFMNGNDVTSGIVVLRDPQNIKENYYGGTYRIQTQEQYNTDYVGFSTLVQIGETYKTKKDLINKIISQ